MMPWIAKTSRVDILVINAITVIRPRKLLKQHTIVRAPSPATCVQVSESGWADGAGQSIQSPVSKVQKA